MSNDDTKLTKPERIERLEAKAETLENRDITERAAEVRAKAEQLKIDVYGTADPNDADREATETVDILEAKARAFENRGMTGRAEEIRSEIDTLEGGGSDGGPSVGLLINDTNSPPRRDRGGGRMVDVVREGEADDSGDIDTLARPWTDPEHVAKAARKAARKGLGR